MALLYTTLDAVKLRLRGKVQFLGEGTSNDDEGAGNEMSDQLLQNLCEEAESEVELDLSVRYAVPFVGVNDEPFKKIRDRSSQLLIKNMSELKAVAKVLDTDFGRGSVVEASKYTERLEKRYKELLDRMVAKRGGSSELMTGWKFPPLQGLKLAYFNQCGDDGYAGQVLITSSGHGGYPKHQINDPAESFYAGLWDE